MRRMLFGKSISSPISIERVFKLRSKLLTHYFCSSCLHKANKYSQNIQNITFKADIMHRAQIHLIFEDCLTQLSTLMSQSLYICIYIYLR